MTPKKIYLSHKISAAETADKAAQAANCIAAQKIGKAIQDALPMVEVYIPGGPTERFVSRAYEHEYMDVKQILEVDCEIVLDCDMLVCHAPGNEKIDGGRLIEVNYAITHGIPNYIFDEPEHAIQFIDTFFKLGALA